MITFIWPWLLVLLPLPWLYRRFRAEQPRQTMKLLMPSAMPMVASGATQRHPQLPHIVLALIWLLLVAALARPQWQGEPIGRPLEGRDLMVAVDLSGSMAQQDMQLNGQMVDRLTIVKHVLKDFIERRQGDRIGLVLFADTAYLQAPLTFDRFTVATFLDEAVLGLVGRQTAIGDAIGVSIKQILNQQSEHRVLVLLTDGDNTSGSLAPEEAVKLAQKHNVTIYTVGVGAEVMTRRSLLGTRNINPSADLNEEALQSIAQATGGQYFRATDGQSLEQIYQTIDALEPTASDETFYRPVIDVFFYPLAAAMALALLLMAWQQVANSRWGNKATDLASRRGR
ncbi:VWA domain-containing protein [Neiella sp. HB171785]|uniref:VWA domain-containing protein n=1 Tax=Neiella litorisoli TaxID=2771431 RepID=A0A8J6R3E8_9GAMM|nr:VWA domain-containing protein [Neiella litorisoli]MBD1390250.1 VWA domain-containing protein [Neiella litorisoli]